MRLASLGFGLILISSGHPLAAEPTEATSHTSTPIAFPGGEAGIGFDDLGYSRSLGKVLVPSGRTGRLNLVDPATLEIVSIPGFTTQPAFNGGHDDGITSVAEGAGLLFVTDRTSLQLSLVDPRTKSIVGQTALGASPDYVRWLEPTHELWVSEPDSERIEVFKLQAEGTPRATKVATIAVAEGPESLILDVKRGRAYTHASGKTTAIDLKTRAIVATWENGCKEPTGMALDAERGFVFDACEEGGVRVLDAATGKHLSHVALGAGIDIISYNADLAHLYVPSGETAKLAILAVSPKGTLSLLGTFPATKDSHCIAVDGKVYFGDPEHGRLLVLVDPFPSSRR